MKAQRIIYKHENGRPSELRLYSLKRFYERKTKDYRTQLKNHHTATEEDEYFRKLYEEETMPHLEIEPITTAQTHQMKKELRKIQNLFHKEPEDEYGEWLEEHPEEYERMRKQAEKDAEVREKWRKEHPEEAKLQDEQIEKDLEYFEEHDTQLHIEYLEDKVRELENRLKEIENMVKKSKKNRA